MIPSITFIPFIYSLTHTHTYMNKQSRSLAILLQMPIPKSVIPMTHTTKTAIFYNLCQYRDLLIHFLLDLSIPKHRQRSKTLSFFFSFIRINRQSTTSEPRQYITRYIGSIIHSPWHLSTLRRFGHQATNKRSRCFADGHVRSSITK